MIEIRTLLAEVLAKHILVVFDSCFAGTIFQARDGNTTPTQMTPDVIAKLMERPSRDIITAGRANERVPAHSPIPKLLLAALNGAADPFKHGVISAAEINLYLRSQILGLSGVDLTPQQGRLSDPNFAEGEFLFRIPSYVGAPDDGGQSYEQMRSTRDVPAPSTAIAGGPSAIVECEADQCTRGGGGAIWLFEGNHGQAMWRYGAIADLTVESFDGRNIVIYRSDPLNSYSSDYAPPGQHFIARYEGTIHGNRIDGTVIWMNKVMGTWYATIPENLCVPFKECPLDANQVFQLGQNAARAGQYSAALRSFLIAASQGNTNARRLAEQLKNRNAISERNPD